SLAILHHLLGQILTALLKIFKRVAFRFDRRAFPALLQRVARLIHRPLRPAECVGDLTLLAKAAHQLAELAAQGLLPLRKILKALALLPVLTRLRPLTLLARLTTLRLLQALPLRLTVCLVQQLLLLAHHLTKLVQHFLLRLLA